MRKGKYIQVWLALAGLVVLGCWSASPLAGQSCVSPPPGLIAWWPGDGDTADIVGGRNGVWAGWTAPPPYDLYAPGKVGQAFSFIGSNGPWPPRNYWGGNAVLMAQDPIWAFGAGGLTIDLWAYFNRVQGRDLFISHDDGGGQRQKWIFWFDAGPWGHAGPGGAGPSPDGPHLRFHLNGTSSDGTWIGPRDPISAPWQPVPGRWYHVAVTRDPQGNWAMYVDGVCIGTSWDPIPLPTASWYTPVQIGGWSEEGNFFDGLIDEVEIFKRALSPQEIYSIFAAGSAGKCKGPAGDTSPPKTTAVQTPVPSSGGWNNTPVTIALAATDEPGGSGVKWIEYAVGAAGWVAQPGNAASVSIAGAGLTRVRFRATDNAGNVEAEKSLEVRIDLAPPVISGLPSAGCTLWPPNHRLVQVAVVQALDHGGSGIAGAVVVTAASNEPDNGLGDGDAAPDIVIAGGVVQLRAERSGSGSGRIYTIVARASDLAGNSTLATASCTVPLNMGK